MRLKLTNVPHMRTYGECQKFEYGKRRDGVKGPAVYGYFPYNSGTFEVWYYDTLIITHTEDGYTVPLPGTIVPTIEWASMNTAVVLSHFLPQNYVARYRFNYDAEFGRRKINERIELHATAPPHCVTRNLAAEHHPIMLWSD